MSDFLKPDASLITALIYTDSEAADRLLRQTALDLLAKGHVLAGLVQHNHTLPGHSRCDMYLEDLATGEHVPISQDRGPHARGCMLDVGQLLAATQAVRQSLGRQTDLVILNKFGKVEGEGGGLRALIAEVIEAGVPLLIAVPWRNIDSWRNFAGLLSEEVMMEAAAPISYAALSVELTQRIARARSDRAPTGAACAETLRAVPLPVRSANP